MKVWTDETLLWALHQADHAGRSASSIAEALTKQHHVPISRSSVLGALHRIKVTFPTHHDPLGMNQDGTMDPLWWEKGRAL